MLWNSILILCFNVQGKRYIHQKLKRKDGMVLSLEYFPNDCLCLSQYQVHSLTRLWLCMVCILQKKYITFLLIFFSSSVEKDGPYIKNKVGKFSFSLKIIKEQMLILCNSMVIFLAKYYHHNLTQNNKSETEELTELKL